MTKESPPSKASARPTKMGTTRSPRGAMMQRPTKRPGHITDCDLALRLMDSCLPDLADGPVPFDCGHFDQSRERQRLEVQQQFAWNTMCAPILNE
jgi:hypothetical protein